MTFSRIFLLLLTAWVLVLPSQAQAAQLGLVTDLTWGAGAADQDRTYQAIGDLGAKWVRLQISWNEVEPEQGTYHPWSLDQVDRAVDRLEGMGVNVDLLIHGAPTWATGSTNPNDPPRNAADYARFAGFVADRYKGRGVEGYEIWNEPNIGRFWKGAPSAAEYVTLLRAAHDAIKGADPTARVVFGGLSGSDTSYVNAAYAAGAKGLFDVMAVHPYTCASDPATSDQYVRYRDVRAAMVAQQDVRPMWFTEFGWSTSSAECGVSEAQQAAFLQSAMARTAPDTYVQAAMAYSLRNNYWSGDSDELEARYGLFTTTWRAKPSYEAFRQLTGAAGSAAPAPAQPTSASAAPSPAPDTGTPTSPAVIPTVEAAPAMPAATVPAVPAGATPKARAPRRAKSPPARTTALTMAAKAKQRARAAWTARQAKARGRTRRR